MAQWRAEHPTYDREYQVAKIKPLMSAQKEIPYRPMCYMLRCVEQIYKEQGITFADSDHNQKVMQDMIAQLQPTFPMATPPHM